MGKEEFLRLLVTQLSNQDPLNPLESQEFAVQLAQFSSVEQLINIQNILDQQGEMYGLLSQNINSGVAADLLGKHVEATSNQVTWSGDGEVPLSFDLAAPATEVTLTIRNAAGAVVHTRSLGAHDEGSQQAPWDGTNKEDQPLPEGTYTFEITAQNADGGSVDATTYLSGRVERVTFGADGIMLWVNGTQVALGMVRSVASEID